MNLDWPQRMPARVAWSPPLTKTGEPLSPPWTPAKTPFWQSIVTLEKPTLASMQVLIKGPRVPPVVRPTLYRREPANGLPGRVPVMGRRGTAGLTWSVPAETLHQSGFAILLPPENEALLEAAKAASEYRHTRPAGQMPP